MFLAVGSAVMAWVGSARLPLRRATLSPFATQRQWRGASLQMTSS